MTYAFTHRQAAHCETGVTSNLLDFYGLAVSEPLVFGIGAGLFFSYLPFIKVNGAPGLSYRPLPGQIFSRAAKRLRLTIHRRRFRRPEQAMRALDEALAEGIPVGCQVGVFHLPFFPPAYRFHFNAHNLVCFGKEDGHYLVSDPVMEGVHRLTPDELARVRFAKGVLAPRGHMYYLAAPSRPIDLPAAVLAGIRQNSRWMLDLPIPLLGVKGIRFLARRMPKWPGKVGERLAALYLGQVVRMQEEIGTGGAGFRFMYAAFLQEAAQVLQQPALLELSKEMTEIGDEWREFALAASRIYKGRQSQGETYQTVAQRLSHIADREAAVFLQLRRL